MGLKLSRSRLSSALAVRFPGKKAIPQLQAEWASQFGDQPSTSTCGRWLTGALPQTSDDLWKLAKILEVDPIGLVEIEVIQGEEVDSFIRMFQLDKWGQYPAISYIKDFVGRQAQWPHKDYLEKYFPDNPWRCIDFTHDANLDKNFYQMVAISSKVVEKYYAIRTFHIAFRQEFLFAGRWLQFGLMIRTPEKVLLLHINGDMQSYIPGDPLEPLRFETFFGPESATFRVACLHDFSLELLESPSPELNAVRFR